MKKYSKSFGIWSVPNHLYLDWALLSHKSNVVLPAFKLSKNFSVQPKSSDKYVLQKSVIDMRNTAWFFIVLAMFSSINWNKSAKIKTVMNCTKNTFPKNKQINSVSHHLSAQMFSYNLKVCKQTGKVYLHMGGGCTANSW